MIKSIKLPPKVQHTANALMEQQMWCWGCDVRRADGNLLMLYGAEKRPSPEPRFHSAYTFYLEEDYTRHEVNGLLISAREGAPFIADLEGAMRRRLLEDAPLRQRMGEAGRTIAETEFSLERVVKETFALYDSLLHQT